MDPLAKAKRSKKTVTTILVVTAILAIVSVITGYYYLQINDVSPQDSNASQGCACYYVASTDTLKSCSGADPKQAFEFQTGTVSTNNTCSAKCDLNNASKLVNSSTVLACRVDDFAINPGCVDISVEDGQENRYANTIPQNKELTIKAKFTTPQNATSTGDFYSGFSFVINGAKTELQAAQAASTGTGAGKEYVISTKLKDYSSADALTVQAFGTSTTGAQLTSDACNRVLVINKPVAPTCTDLSAEIINDTSKKPKVNEVALSTAALTNPKSLSIKFTIGAENNTLTTKNISTQLSNNTLVLSKSYLYKASNFVDNKSFSLLDNQKDSIDISAQLYVNGTAIDSENCEGNFTIPVIEEGTPSTPTDNGSTDNPTDNPTETPTDNNNNGGTDNPTETPTDTGNTSSFTVSKSGSISCVERTSPSNSIKYTITVENTDSDTEGITRIEDKLPLGFSYLAGSTYINGALQDDSGLVTVTEVGNSEQITFTDTSGWSLAANETLTIKFTAKVGSNALTGSNLNEVVVVPVNTPVNSSSLRTSSAVTVAQSCTAPETGLFDSTLSKIILSIFIIFLGTFFYFSQSGILLSEKLVTSEAGNAVRKFNLWRRDPKKYFEETFIEKLEKRKK